MHVLWREIMAFLDDKGDVIVLHKTGDYVHDKFLLSKSIVTPFPCPDQEPTCVDLDLVCTEVMKQIVGKISTV